MSKPLRVFSALAFHTESAGNALRPAVLPSLRDDDFFKPGKKAKQPEFSLAGY